jgi:hypothetical protein
MMRQGLLALAATAPLVATETARAEPPTAAAEIAPNHDTAVPANTRQVEHSVAFSYEDGIWGAAWVQGLRITVPLHPHWGLVMRPLTMMQMPMKWTYSEGGDAYRTDLGGRVELYAASALLLNFARVYGGGGPQVFYSAAGVAGPKATFGGGGHLGCEFFLAPRAALFTELGATSGAQGGFGAGGSAMLGLTWYPWASTRAETLVGSSR